jgi:serine/threonine-protein kinase
MVNPTPAGQPADRNLLLGVLALNLGFLAPEALVQGVRCWVADRSRSLGQVLQQQGALDGPTCGQLEQLVQKHLEAHAGDPRKSLAAVGSLSQVRELLLCVCDPEVQALMTDPLSPPPPAETLFPATLVGGSCPAPTPSPAPVLPGTRSGDSGRPSTGAFPPPEASVAGTLLGGSADPSAEPLRPAEEEQPASLERTAGTTGLRYRVLRSHAKGGLGEVFVAHDEELGREVALKEIQRHHADHPDSRARFLLEGEITGSLEHPGIVPIYGLGVYADGRPFYAMRFIKGERFQDAIARFHSADRAGLPPGQRALELRRLLGRFVAVCNAVAYAHSRGVLHRDLKPENIMLGAFGETLVVDWGLAKRLHGAESRVQIVGQAPVASACAGARLLSSDSGTPTQQGDVIGTPSFMSPEQAAGRLDEMGPPSDVYSLGATLYCLLTGRPPFHEHNLHVLLDKVRDGDFPRPRQLSRAVPAPLEAICLKAMALRAEERYPTAQALAGDVEHWLADEPVSAYREPLTARLGRWARHHRTLVAGWAGLLVTAVVALGVTTALVSREQRETAKQRRLAEDNFRTAVRAVDDMLTEVAQEQLASEPRMEKKRKALLAHARTYYQQFLAQHGDNPHLRKEAALAHKRLGDISRWLGGRGGLDEARAAYEQAIAMLEDLEKAHPDEPAYRHELGMCYDDLGEVWRRTSHLKEAFDCYTRAVALQKELVASYPDRGDYRRELGRTHDNLGIYFKDTHRLKESEEAFQEAIRQFDRLAKDHPDNPEYRQHLARANLNRGPVLQALGRPEEALQAYEHALDLQSRLAADDPETLDYSYELGVTYNNLGFLLESTKALEQAGLTYRRALDLFHRLALDYPAVPVFRREQAITQNNLAIVLARGRRWKEAADLWGKALEQFTKLAAGNPDVPDYKGRQGMAEENLGWLLLQQTNELDAASCVLAVGASASAPAPLVSLGAVLAGQRRGALLGESRDRLEKGMTLTRIVLEPNPRNPDFLQALRDQTEYLAEVHLALGEHAEAARLAEALPAVFGTRAKDYVVAAGLVARCLTVAEGDTRLPEEQRRTAQDRYAGRAVALLQQGVARGYRDAEALGKSPFTALRQRPDYQKLLAGLKGGPAPRQP